MRIYKVKNYDEMSVLAANFIKSVVTLKPSAVLGLATGSTPIGLYKKLIEWNKNGEIDFSNCKSVNLDEYVGLTGSHDQSYRYFMNTNLFDYINIDKNKTNVPNGVADDFDAECKRYDNIINSMGQIDIQVLGIGPNGHIGFNEPDDHFTLNTHIVSLTNETLEANKRFFSSIDEVPKKAITMGIKPIVNAKHVILLASGKAKANAVHDLVKGNVTPNCPASILQLKDNAYIIVDEEAALKL